MRAQLIAFARLLAALTLLTGCAAAPTAAPPAPAAAPTAVAAPTAPAATAAPAATPSPSPEPVAPWWNDAVFYEVFVRSFYDSDGDGVGDLPGLIEKLDYLNDGDPATGSDLGVTGIWLMPIAQSPSYHGYDVVDYKAIDDEYGTGEDFTRLIDEAHRRGIKVIVDLVVNHTSAQHPWFMESIDPASPKHDWYIWSAEPAGPNWHDVGKSEKYYGYFGGHMPDLNYDNPAVTEAMFDIVRFWLEEMHVDGFRLDAIKYIAEEGRTVEHAPATFEWLEDFHKFYKGIDPYAFTVGEVWAETMIAEYYVPDKVDAVFEFSLAEAMLQSAQLGDRARVERAQTNVNKTYPPGQFATFLANHDQNRTRSRMKAEGQAFVAASLQLLYPGVPFIYYGEEIGMKGEKPDEDIRRPMQWTAEGGFTTGEPWRAYYDDLAERSVAGQESDRTSLLNHYRSLIGLRNTYPALRTGSWQPVTAPKEQAAVYAFMRTLGEERFLVLINLGDEPVTDYQLSLEAAVGASAPAQPVKAELVFGPADAAGKIPALQAGSLTDYRPVTTLPAYSTFVIRFAP